MIGRTHGGLLVWLLAAALVECELAPSAAPTAPSPPDGPAAPTLIGFAEPDTWFSTPEVHLAGKDGYGLARTDGSYGNGKKSIFANVTGDTKVDEARRP
jgi:hypothetical protein